MKSLCSRFVGSGRTHAKLYVVLGISLLLAIFIIYFFSIIYDGRGNNTISEGYVNEMNIFQTHKSQDMIQNNPQLLDATTSWKRHTQFSYHFYDNDACEKFMKELMPDVYPAYSKLSMGVMRADIWRYCIIYYYGGIYADADTICVREDPSDLVKDAEENTQLIVVPETDDVHLCQWIFAAPKQSPILKSVIDTCVERIMKWDGKMKEHIIHYLTGPGAFTAGIESYLQKQNLPTYQNKLQYVSYQTKVNPVLYVFPTEFHETYVKHLFAGDDIDHGWKPEATRRIHET